MTDGSPREIEAKFELDPADRNALIAIDRVGDFRVTYRESARQVDTYFDTADRRLGRVPSSLRVRRKAGGVLMTFKGGREATSADEAHIASRLEDEVVVPEDYAGRVNVDAPLPDEASLSPLRRARGIVGDVPLLPVALLENERTAITLRDDAGQLLELSVDRVVGTRMSDGCRVEWDEAELETKAADRAALLRLSDALREIAPSLRPNRVTKLERVLGRPDDVRA